MQTKGKKVLEQGQRQKYSRLHSRSWGFALRKGVFAETKEGICRNKNIKTSFKGS